MNLPTLPVFVSPISSISWADCPNIVSDMVACDFRRMLEQHPLQIDKTINTIELPEVFKYAHRKRI